VSNTLLYVLLALQFVTLLAAAAALLRRSRPVAADSRLDAVLAADLPRELAGLNAQTRGIADSLRTELTQLRKDNAESGIALRKEVLDTVSLLGQTLQTGLSGFRTDNATAAERLRQAVDSQLSALTGRMTAFVADSAQRSVQASEALHTRRTALGQDNAAQQERLRQTVEARLDALNVANTAKLEEMRLTVDEKLHATLQTRLTESFGQVTDQLAKVHSGLGEMTKLSAGVDDLSRIFTNVKARGTFGEVLLESLLKQMLAASQYEKNPRVKPNTQELVEFAVKLPTPDGETLLPIDSKFPREVWERLETAYETGEDIVSAGKAFETAIRNEGKKICEKYIAPPRTTPFAIMFLPTEGLYAEVMRRDGLQSDIQQNCRVTIAGPSTLAAILNSFQMGFHMLQLQQKGDEVWKVLANARSQFGKFEDLMTKMDDQVGKVQKTIQEVGTRTRAINRTLRDVSLESAEAPTGILAQPGFDGLLPMLRASDED
jgi:DNA recombination protein RmuC